MDQKKITENIAKTLSNAYSGKVPAEIVQQIKQMIISVAPRYIDQNGKTNIAVFEECAKSCMALAVNEIGALDARVAKESNSWRKAQEETSKKVVNQEIKAQEPYNENQETPSAPKGELDYGSVFGGEATVGEGGHVSVGKVVFGEVPPPGSGSAVEQ